MHIWAFIGMMLFPLILGKVRMNYNEERRAVPLR